MKLNLTVNEYFMFFEYVLDGGAEDDDSKIVLLERSGGTEKILETVSEWDDLDNFFDKYGDRKISSVEMMINKDFSTETKIFLFGE